METDFPEDQFAKGEDSELFKELQAEAAARAQAFQTWWASADGDNYRNLHRKVSKAEADDAFRAGWGAYGEALDQMDDGGYGETDQPPPG